MSKEPREFWIDTNDTNRFSCWDIYGMPQNIKREFLVREVTETGGITDTERFYFLAKNQICIQEYKGKFTCFGGILITLNLGYSDTPREAIDKAIEESRK